jgi:Ca2+-binding EF-hand superfamily protein
LKEEVIIQNPDAAAVLKKIYEMDHNMKIDLDSRFRAFDAHNTGIIKKNDFVNVIHENVRSIQASELMSFMNLFTTSFDDVVNYDDFLKVLYKFGDMHIATQIQPTYGQDYSPSKNTIGS